MFNFFFIGFSKYQDRLLEESYMKNGFTTKIVGGGNTKITNNMERKLVTIRTIGDIQPISFLNKETGEMEVASAIERASIDGWNVVVKKNEFQVGDYCVYFEIDSLIPVKPWNEFLLKGKPDNGKPIRLKTIKLCGQISQGLIMPLSILADYGFIVDALKEDGLDYSKVIGVEKYEPPEDNSGGNFGNSGHKKGNFPAFIPKTDQERIQNTPAILKSPLKYEVTEKGEGSSITQYFYNGVVGVCSRNQEIKRPEGDLIESKFWQGAINSGIVDFLERKKLNIAIQGELVGPGVQGNIYKLNELEVYVYDIYLIDELRYLTAKERIELLHGEPIKHVPIIHEEFVCPENIEDVLAMAEGKTVIGNNPNQEREGLVFKCVDMPHISWKAINNNYLLKQK